MKWKMGHLLNQCNGRSKEYDLRNHSIDCDCKLIYHEKPFQEKGTEPNQLHGEKLTISSSMRERVRKNIFQHFRGNYVIVFEVAST